MPELTGNQKIFEGMYTVSRHVADGGTSSVYEVQSNDGHLYALKIITHTRMRLEANYEISVLRKLNLLVFSGDYGVHNFPGIVMSFYSGSCLNWHLAEFKEYTLIDRLKFMQYMISEVNNLHSQNIIHGDISPSNFIYNQQTGMFHIIDFSWSRIVPGDFNAGLQCNYWGWRWFNAPEHDMCKGLAGGSLTLKPSADIYQLGQSMLYILGKADYTLYQAQPSVCSCEQIETLIRDMTDTKPENRPNISQVLETFRSINTQICNEMGTKPAKSFVLRM